MTRDDLADILGEQTAACGSARDALIAGGAFVVRDGRLPADRLAHGLPVRAARNTALMEAITDLPPIVVADLFGISPATAHRWSQLAGNSWAPYLAARQRSRP
ncbi:hypothetical protein [Streptomyces mirabilis]|uniref:hypothetical protein n=1 Tax=Streptomyces mirabilis TaxID=68239 RepID=UPI00367DACB0